MSNITITDLYDLNETIAADLFEGVTYPWEVLSKIKDYIIALGATLNEEKYEKRGENIWIAKSAKVAPTACLNGPLIVDEDAEIRHCAFVRGSAIVGKGAVVGNSTELKNCNRDCTVHKTENICSLALHCKSLPTLDLRRKYSRNTFLRR